MNCPCKSSNSTSKEEEECIFHFSCNIDDDDDDEHTEKNCTDFKKKFRLHREYVWFWQRGPLWSQFGGNLHIFDQSFGQFGWPTSYFVVSKTTMAQKTESSLFPPPNFKFFLQFIISHPIMSRAQKVYSLNMLVTIHMLDTLGTNYVATMLAQGINKPT